MRFLDDNDDDDVYDGYDAEFLKAGDAGEQVPAKYVKMLVVKCKIAKDYTFYLIFIVLVKQFCAY